MIPLDKDLQNVKSNLAEFGKITERVLQYLPNVLSNSEETKAYSIHSSEIAGTVKFTRPVNKELFEFRLQAFISDFEKLQMIFTKIKEKRNVTDIEREIIDRTLYTIQQSIGVGLDLLVNPNSARKHMGNRFEELIKVVFTEIGVANKKIVLQIPYETEDGKKTYKCENDLIISPYEIVKSTSTSLDEKEVVVSVKTTSKDRMGKIFIDKLLLQKFVDHPQKVIGIFLNDVQRKETNNVSFTLVSGLFMVYSKFLTELEGIYYLDPPPNAAKQPYSKHMNRFSELLVKDLYKLLSS